MVIDTRYFLGTYLGSGSELNEDRSRLYSTTDNPTLWPDFKVVYKHFNDYTLSDVDVAKPSSQCCDD